MIAALVIVLILAIIPLGFLLYRSPGTLVPIHDENGKPAVNSISEKRYVNIGGIRQGMFLRGRDLDNPVLLFVHGGPSFSEFFLVEKYPSGLEEIFTVCYWDQRGGGLSYDPSMVPESLTLEQLESDLLEVTEYLRGRFSVDKIYLMAHSGGSAFAIRAAAKAPELFHAYIGMAQITRQPDSEKLAYEYMIDRYESAGNTRMVSKLKEFNVLTSDSLVLPFFESVLRDKCMHELGIGTMHNMKSIISDIFIPAWTCRAYTLKEKVNIWRSKFSFIKKTGIRSQILSSDIPDMVPKLDIPVYFFSGKYDFTVNHDLSRAYLNMLNAPVKGFYTFENSAHSPLFEEPLRVREILVKDVLNGTITLSGMK
jgi:pimeloyl-ACP methyl ester carboxylesterase